MRVQRWVSRPAILSPPSCHENMDDFFPGCRLRPFWSGRTCRMTFDAHSDGGLEGDCLTYRKPIESVYRNGVMQQQRWERLNEPHRSALIASLRAFFGRPLFCWRSLFIDTSTAVADDDCRRSFYGQCLQPTHVVVIQYYIWQCLMLRLFLGTHTPHLNK